MTEAQFDVLDGLIGRLLPLRGADPRIDKAASLLLRFWNEERPKHPPIEVRKMFLVASDFWMIDGRGNYTYVGPRG